MGLTWLALGDSITKGTGASVYTNNYVHLTRQTLMQNGKKHKLVKASIGGITSGGLLSVYDFHGALCDADLITIMLGTNDISQNVPISTYQANLSAMIDDLRNKSQNGQCQIVLLSVLWTPGIASTVGSYNSAVQSLAQSKNVLFCDTYQAFNTTSYLISDNVHPNDSGHQAVANILAPFLQNVSAWNNVRTRG